MSAHPDVLRLEAVTRKFGGSSAAVTAVDGVSLAASAGELIVVMGPSGSGKTTLLQMCGALLHPTSGRVWINGTEVGALDDRQLTAIRLQQVGFVFQAFQLLASLTALENVRLVLEAARRGRSEANERARQLLVELGLDDRLDARPETLSGGEKQRVAVARALANDPTLILADEPTGNLDSRTGASVMRLLDDAVHRRHKTVLCVTHDDRVRAFADRVLRIEDGRLVDQ